jgi:hypothetical protein
MKTMFHTLKAAAFLGGCLAFSWPGRLQAVCACDPDLFFQTRAETTFPVASASTVDVNLGNSPTAFVRAAYYQIAGVDAPAPFLADQVGRLTSTASTYWRRIDTVNTIMDNLSINKPKAYSDPWTTKPAFTSAPCKNEARDVGAVLMMFFNCPGGTNCGMDWANTHTYGMDQSDALYGGYANPPSNSGFFYLELMDARYAGLQFFLPNLYGPELGDGSIANLVTALGQVHSNYGSSEVQVGLFDDTSSWNNANFNYSPWNNPPDMNTPSQTAASAAKIVNNKWKPYFQSVPSQYWYEVNGRPLIYFYNGGTWSTGLANSSAVIQAAKSQFYTAVGVTPFVAVDIAFFQADANMVNVADAEFKWKTVNNGVPNNLSSYTLNGITLDHAMVKWDPLARDSPMPTTVVANANTGTIKGTDYLSAALANSLSDNAKLLVLATWNDLGEGTGINRNYDYYYQGQWLPPDAFMSLIRASQSQQSCPPIGTTATTTPTFTMTPTPVVTPSHGSLVADLEDNTANAHTYWNLGNIVQYHDVNSTSSIPNPPGWTATSATAPGSSSAYAACWSGTLAPSAGNPYSFLAFELIPGGSINSSAVGGAWTDVQPYSPNKGLRFDYKAATAGVEYEVQLTTEEVGSDYGYYALTFTSTNTSWNTLTVYFPGQGASPAFAQPGYAAPVAWDPSKVGAIIFQPMPQSSSVAYGLCVDNITFAVAPAPTATPTASPSPTDSATATGSATASPSASVSPTITLSPTPSNTPNGSFTETVTSSVSPSLTQSPTLTLTFSLSPSFSSSATLTQTPVLTATPSSTATATLSASPTVSPSFSASPSVSATPTDSPTQVATPTWTRSPSPTPSGPAPLLAILDAVVAPNPVTGKQISLAVKLSSSATGFQVKLYSSALTAVETSTVHGSFQEGWNRVTLKLSSPLANGLYFATIVGLNDPSPRVGFKKTLKLYVMP